MGFTALRRGWSLSSGASRSSAASMPLVVRSRGRILSEVLAAFPCNETNEGNIVVYISIVALMLAIIAVATEDPGSHTFGYVVLNSSLIEPGMSSPNVPSTAAPLVELFAFDCRKAPLQFVAKTDITAGWRAGKRSSSVDVFPTLARNTMFS